MRICSSVRSLVCPSVVCVALWIVACSQPPAIDVDAGGPDAEPPPPSAADLYPDLDALYGGPEAWQEQTGIYRGCGPNGGVCHNGREYPNLRSIESITSYVGRGCNQRRERPTEIHHMCEERGDVVLLGPARDPLEIGWIEPMGEPSSARSFVVSVRGTLPEGPLDPHIVREDEVLGLTSLTAPLETGGLGSSERIDDSRFAMHFLPPEADDAFGTAGYYASIVRSAGRPGDVLGVHVGDPNRDGRFGADDGGRLIAPGEPMNSYLMRRLIDPSVGSLMPLANCCSWSREALRGLWCWIAGLAPDGANARDPIDYEHCPDGPPDTVIYPTPGPECLASGMCPVRAREHAPGEGSWAAVSSILRRSCAGSSCHVGAAGVTFFIPMEEEAAYHAVLARVTPGSAESSPLYQRVEPELCAVTPGCNVPMPLGMPALSPEDRESIRAWVAGGALP